MAREFPLAIVVSAVDRATKPIREINKRVARAFEPMRRLQRSLGMFAKETGLTKLAGRVTAVGTAAGRVGQEFWSLGRRIGFFAVGAGAALFGLLKGTANAGDSAMKMARRLGVSVEWLQAFRFAAERSGIAMATVDMAVQRAGRRIGEFVATGRGEAMPVLKAMGFTRDQLKTLGSIDKILPLVFAKLSQVKDANVRNAMAMKLFDSEGVAVVQMLENGVEGVEALMAEARRLGLVLSEDAARGSERFNDGLTNMMGALKGVRNVIATTLMPMMEQWIKQIEDFLVRNRPQIEAWARDFMRDLPDRLKALKQGFDDFMSVMRPLAGTIAGVIERLGGLKFVAIALAVIMGGKLLFAIFGLAKALVLFGTTVATVAVKLGVLLWPALVKLYAVALPLLVAALAKVKVAMIAMGIATAATPIGWIIAGVAALAAGAYLLIKHWDKVKEFFSGLWDGVLSGLDWVTEKLAQGFKKLTGMLPDWVKRRLGIEVEGEPSPGMGAPVGVEQMARQVVPGAAGRGEAHVTVDFENMPRGARVRQAPDSDADLDLNLGYSMVTP